MRRGKLTSVHKYTMANRIILSECVKEMHDIFTESLLALATRAQKVAAYTISDSQRIMSSLIGVFFINT